jgi:hypothetical protein
MLNTHLRKSIIFILFGLFLYSCKEEQQFTDDTSVKLNFSTDTVNFDTVFMSIGSVTKQFKFYNNNNKPVKTTISLAEGGNSFFRLNVDGQVTDRVVDYEVMANDSVFVFVEVNVDPQNPQNPMVISDSVVFITNGNMQNVKLEAYGQDIHLYTDSVINTSTTWIADKPYLIYNSILINKDVTLSVEEGVKIYFHNESAMWVLGTLEVQGTSSNPVYFQGDRLDSWYEYSPGQWYGYYRNDSMEYLTGGIHFWQGSKNNIINHAIVKNGVKGIQIDYKDENSSNPTLVLSNSIVKNMSAIGLLAQTSDILVYNTVIANCGYYAVVLNYGGNYGFYHTTIGNYYEFDTRKTPSLIFNNYYMIKEDAKVFDFNAEFGNCIIYGNLDNEFLFDLKLSDNKNVGFTFDHCLMKLDEDFDTSNDNIYKDIIRDKDSLPRFINTYEGNFRLDTLSSAKDNGSSKYSSFPPLDKDQDGVDRNLDKNPDIGAYERIE